MSNYTNSITKSLSEAELERGVERMPRIKEAAINIDNSLLDQQEYLGQLEELVSRIGNFPSVDNISKGESEPKREESVAGYLERLSITQSSLRNRLRKNVEHLRSLIGDSDRTPTSANS